MTGSQKKQWFNVKYVFQNIRTITVASVSTSIEQKENDNSLSMFGRIKSTECRYSCTKGHHNDKKKTCVRHFLFLPGKNDTNLNVQAPIHAFVGMLC